MRSKRIQNYGEKLVSSRQNRHETGGCSRETRPASTSDLVANGLFRKPFAASRTIFAGSCLQIVSARVTTIARNVRVDSRLLFSLIFARSLACGRLTGEFQFPPSPGRDSARRSPPDRIHPIKMTCVLRWNHVTHKEEDR